MKIAVRALLYLVLIGLAMWTGRGFVDSFKQSGPVRDLTEDALTSAEPTKPATSPAAPAEPATNEVPVVATPAAAGSNALAEAIATNLPPADIGTNDGVALLGTNATPELAASITNEPAVVSPAPEAKAEPKKAAKKTGQMVPFLGGFVLSVAFLGLLAARDFANFFANKSLEFLFNDDGKGQKNPALEAAEAVWASGDKLEAVRMMREYYEKNPREVFVALRIAEIYEQDLGNYLAAALELEEVLKKKLPTDRWGWTALRLCNIYSKLNKHDQAVDLLRRVAVEYSETPAAEKARKRLQQVDPEFFATLAVPGNESADDSAEAESSEPPPSADPQSHLPRGFRPKK